MWSISARGNKNKIKFVFGCQQKGCDFMAKLWSKPRRIEVYQRDTRRKVAEFIADDACSVSPLNTFYLDGKEVYWYNERECYYKSFELE